MLTAVSQHVLDNSNKPHRHAVKTAVFANWFVSREIRTEEKRAEITNQTYYMAAQSHHQLT